MSSLFRVNLCSREPFAPGRFPWWGAIGVSWRRAIGRLSARAVALCAAVAFCVAAGVPNARAAEWYVDTGVRQDVEYDDNIGLSLTSDQVVSDTSFESSIVANAGVNTPNLNIRLDSLFNFSVFVNQDQLNSNDQYITLGTDYTYGRSVWGVQGDFVHDTSRTSDVDATGLFILDNKSRFVYRAGPTWSYQLSPRDTLDTSATYTTVNYPSGDLRDYDQVSGSVGYAHVLTPRTQVISALDAYYYDSNKFGSLDSQFVGLLLGGSHVLSKTLRLSALVGPRVVRQESRSSTASSSESSTDVGYIADASITYEPTERTFFEGQYTRTTEPNTTTGALLNKDEFRLYGRYNLLEKVAIDLTARYFMQDSPTNVSEDRSRQYVSFQPGVRWRLLKELSLNCFYRFRWQKYDQLKSENGTQGDSNSVYARLSYDLPTLSTSR